MAAQRRTQKRIQPNLKYQTRVKDLVGELRRIRALVREVGDGYIVRREAAAAEMIRSLQEDLSTGRRRPSRVTAWEKQLKQFREAKIKPAKGRNKDLRRIDGLLTKLGSIE